MNMSSKYTVVLAWVICLSCEVAVTGCEVVLVNRNVADSFRIGKYGCTNDTSICTQSSATCQPDSGLCLCGESGPNFRNPAIESKNEKAYGCIGNDNIRTGFGSLDCELKPFQLIPYNHEERAKQFSDDNQNIKLQNCSLLKAQTKFPDNATEMEPQWLDQSYVDLNVSNKTLSFKWKKSVPNLQGTIITLHLNCQFQSGSYGNYCLRAKVLGSWAADPTNPTAVATVGPNTSSTKQTTSYVIPTGTSMTKPPTSSAGSNPPSEVTSSDDDSSGTIIAIAVVVPVALLTVLVIFVLFFCKRKRSQRGPSRESSWKMNGVPATKQFRYIDSNLHGPNTYVNVQAREINEIFDAQSNLDYATPDQKRRESATSQPDPGYETPDVIRREVNGAALNSGNATPNSQRVFVEANPCYAATPVVKNTEITGTSSKLQAGYETLDMKRKEVNAISSELEPGYSTPDAGNEDNADYSTPDITRVEVNGELYALPDKKKYSEEMKTTV